MALLMGSGGKSHMNFNATFNSFIVFGFGRRLWYFSSLAPHTLSSRSSGFKTGQFGEIGPSQ